MVSILLLLSFVASAHSYAYLMVETPYCITVSLTPGSTIMGSTAVSSTQFTLIVQRDGVDLAPGSTYVSGETLMISTTATTPQFLFQTSLGSFTYGRCLNNYRIANTQNTPLVMPAAGSGDVLLSLGFAPQEGTVSINTFKLRDPGVSTNAPIAPTLKPSFAPVGPTKLPTAAPTHPTTEPSANPTVEPTTTAPTTLLPVAPLVAEGAPSLAQSGTLAVAVIFSILVLLVMVVAERGSKALTPLRRRLHPWLALSLAIFGLIGVAWIGFSLLGDQWMQYSPATGEYFAVDKVGDIGIFLVFVSISMAMPLLQLLTVSGAPLQEQIPLLYYGLIGLLLLVVLIGLGYSYTVLVDPFNYYFWYQGDTSPFVNTLNQVLGGCIVSIYTPVAVTLVVLAYTVHCRSAVAAKSNPFGVLSSTAAAVVPVKDPTVPQPSSFFKHNWLSVVLIAAALFLFFMLTLVLPHLWAITGMNQITAAAYFAVDSTSSVVNGYKLYEGPVTHFVFVNETTTVMNATTGVNTTVTTLVSMPDMNWLQPIIFLKLYPDVLVYYCMLTFIIFVGVTGTYNTPLRRLLHRRLSVDGLIPKAVSLWPVGMCVGELLLVLAMIALHCYWFWYWTSGWPYRLDTLTDTGSQQENDLHLYARVMGEMTVLPMSFLTVPITHNSIWESVFGVPFDRAVKYHRVLGHLTWLFVSLHMLLFQILWLQSGTLANNCWGSTTNLVVLGTMDNPLQQRDNNFTIPIMEAMWGLCSIVLVFAALRTKLPYELFQYTHWLMFLFFLTSFIHSFQSWFFCGGGLALYLMDRCLRLVRSSLHMKMSSLKFYSEANLTRIVIPRSAFTRGYEAGQYCWLNVPAISHYEWHPFTISSAPSMDQVEFSVLAVQSEDWVGKGETWTQKLATLARVYEASKGGNSLTKSEEECKSRFLLADQQVDMQVCVDGPFGRAMPYAEFHTLVFVAGGVGVTPLLSIMYHLVQLKSNSASAPNIKVQEVHFIWVAKDEKLFEAFSHMLNQLDKCLALIFSVKLFATKKFQGVSAPKVEMTATVNLSKTDRIEALKQRTSSTFSMGKVYVDQGVLELSEVKNPIPSTMARESLLSSKETASQEETKDGAPAPVVALSARESQRIVSAMLRQQRLSLTADEFRATGGAAVASACQFKVNYGRPDLIEVFAKIQKGDFATRQRTLWKEPDVAVFVCGPNSLTEEVSNQCFNHDFFFQAEEFII